MERKKIIQIVVIAACFIGSGVVLYNGLYSSSNATAVPVAMVGTSQPGMPGAASSTTAVSVNSNVLLPYGGQPLDFSNLKNSHFQFGAVSFATISTSTDLGVDIQDLIK
jgi:hypothetical protein